MSFSDSDLIMFLLQLKAFNPACKEIRERQFSRKTAKDVNSPQKDGQMNSTHEKFSTSLVTNANQEAHEISLAR